ncbi:hypothetical protein [Streptomyces sp. NPDC001404]|uniref:hypothetical protein n=1 Tax=Streptomyces sp. NPDC001404 TaxID=3364571 RepID=UPI0036B8B5AD
MTTGKDTLSRLTGALAHAFEVPESSVDITESDDWESQNWDARVICEYERLVGDLDWALTISLANEVATQPTEEQLAVHLARYMGAPVLFPADVMMPSLRRLVTPAGDFTYARVNEPEDEGEEFTVDAVETHVPEFPRAAVFKFPELVRLYKIDTPITDALCGESTPKGSFYDVLFGWERLVVRMDAGWPPSAWYPAAMYVEDLQTRDQLEDQVDRLPAAEQSTARQALEEIDANYRRLTVDDGGQALSEVIGSLRSIGSDLPWYWKRRPVSIPWEADEL